MKSFRGKTRFLGVLAGLHLVASLTAYSEQIPVNQANLAPAYSEKLEGWISRNLGEELRSQIPAIYRWHTVNIVLNADLPKDLVPSGVDELPGLAPISGAASLEPFRVNGQLESLAKIVQTTSVEVGLEYGVSPAGLAQVEKIVKEFFKGRFLPAPVVRTVQMNPAAQDSPTSVDQSSGESGISKTILQQLFVELGKAINTMGDRMTKAIDVLNDRRSDQATPDRSAPISPGVEKSFLDYWRELLALGAVVVLCGMLIVFAVNFASRRLSSSIEQAGEGIASSALARPSTVAPPKEAKRQESSESSNASKSMELSMTLQSELAKDPALAREVAVFAAESGKFDVLLIVLSSMGAKEREACRSAALNAGHISQLQAFMASVGSGISTILASEEVLQSALDLVLLAMVDRRSLLASQVRSELESLSDVQIGQALAGVDLDGAKFVLGLIPAQRLAWLMTSGRLAMTHWIEPLPVSDTPLSTITEVVRTLRNLNPAKKDDVHFRSEIVAHLPMSFSGSIPSNLSDDHAKLRNEIQQRVDDVVKIISSWPMRDCAAVLMAMHDELRHEVIARLPELRRRQIESHKGPAGEGMCQMQANLLRELGIEPVSPSAKLKLATVAPADDFKTDSETKGLQRAS